MQTDLKPGVWSERGPGSPGAHLGAAGDVRPACPGQSLLTSVSSSSLVYLVLRQAADAPPQAPTAAGLGGAPWQGCWQASLGVLCHPELWAVSLGDRCCPVVPGRGPFGLHCFSTWDLGLLAVKSSPSWKIKLRKELRTWRRWYPRGQPGGWME